MPRSERNKRTLAAFDDCSNKEFFTSFEGPVYEGQILSHDRAAVKCLKFDGENGSKDQHIDIKETDIPFDPARQTLARQLGCLTCPYRIEEINPNN